MTAENDLNNSSPLMTVHEVAALLRLSSAAVYVWVRVGRMPAIRVGGRWRIRRADVDAIIAGERRVR